MNYQFPSMKLRKHWMITPSGTMVSSKIPASMYVPKYRTNRYIHLDPISTSFPKPKRESSANSKISQFPNLGKDEMLVKFSDEEMVASETTNPESSLPAIAMVTSEVTNLTTKQVTSTSAASEVTSTQTEQISVGSKSTQTLITAAMIRTPVAKNNQNLMDSGKG